VSRYIRFEGKELGCGLAPLHIYLERPFDVLTWLPLPGEDIDYEGRFWFTEKGLLGFVESNDLFAFNGSVPGGLKCRILNVEDVDTIAVTLIDDYQVVIDERFVS